MYFDASSKENHDLIVRLTFIPYTDVRRRNDKEVGLQFSPNLISTLSVIANANNWNDKLVRPNDKISSIKTKEREERIIKTNEDKHEAKFSVNILIGISQSIQ